MQIANYTDKDLLQSDMQATKDNIAKFDQEYQFAMATGDMKQVGKYRKLLGEQRVLFGKLLKVKMTRGWTW